MEGLLSVCGGKGGVCLFVCLSLLIVFCCCFGGECKCHCNKICKGVRQSKQVGCNKITFEEL